MSPTGTSSRRWACETRAKYDFFKKNLLFCISRRGQVRELQPGTSNSTGKSRLLYQKFLPRYLGILPVDPAAFQLAVPLPRRAPRLAAVVVAAARRARLPVERFERGVGGGVKAVECAAAACARVLDDGATGVSRAPRAP